MKTIIKLLVFFVCANITAQVTTIRVGDSLVFLHGSDNFFIKFESSYIKFGSTTIDSIYSDIWGGLAASTPETYWERSGTDLTMINSGDDVGIGMSPSYEKFNVSGNIYASNFKSTFGTNLLVGENTGNGSSMGDHNYITGSSSGQSLTGSYNCFYGHRSGQKSTSASQNAFYGNFAGMECTTGARNTAIGYESGKYMIAGTDNTLIGNEAGLHAGGSWNTIVGSDAGYRCNSYNTFVGGEAGKDCYGSSNVYLGYNAGKNMNYSNTLIIENTNTTVANALISGSFSANTLNFAADLFLNSSANGVSTISPNGDTIATMEDVRSAISDSIDVYGLDLNGIGDQEILYRDGDTISGDSDLTWNDTLLKVLSAIGSDNIFIGTDAPQNIQSGALRNTFIGKQAGYSLTAGDDNSFVGEESGKSNTTGNANVFIGGNSGYSNTYGSINVFIGQNSGYSNQTGSYNIFVGSGSGTGHVEGSNNTFIGKDAGYNNVSGINNVFIGFNAGYNETDSNKLYIDISNTSSPLIWGDFYLDTVVVNGDINVTEKIYADSIYTIKAGAWADNILNKDYKLPILNSRRAFINKNGHLPYLKSGKELDVIAAKQGGYISNNEYFRRSEGILKNVEENTLYILKLEQENQELKTRIEILEQKLNKLLK